MLNISVFYCLVNNPNLMYDSLVFPLTYFAGNRFFCIC